MFMLWTHTMMQAPALGFEVSSVSDYCLFIPWLWACIMVWVQSTGPFLQSGASFEVHWTVSEFPVRVSMSTEQCPSFDLRWIELRWIVSEFRPSLDWNSGNSGKPLFRLLTGKASKLSNTHGSGRVTARAGFMQIILHNFSLSCKSHCLLRWAIWRSQCTLWRKHKRKLEVRANEIVSRSVAALVPLRFQVPFFQIIFLAQWCFISIVLFHLSVKN